MIGLTICSGIGAPEVACPEIDWRLASEIEAFPRAVLEQRHGFGCEGSGKVLIGDFTQLLGITAAETCGKLADFGIPPPHIIVAGTPCQSFSLAGKRESLDDKRGNLMLAFVELCHAIRSAGSLRWAVWENVPGVLSTADNAFGCFLGAIVGAGDALCSPLEGGRWPDAGMVAGPRARACWRVLDAQYFGLAQRRERVFVVAGFGDGCDPTAVLFERQGLRGNSPPSREARERPSGTLSARSSAGGGLGTDHELDGGVVDASVKPSAADHIADVSPTLGKESFSPAKSSSGQMEDFCISQPLLAKGNDSHDDSKQTYVPIDMRQASRGEKLTNNRKHGSGGAPGHGIGHEGDPAFTVSERGQAVIPILEAGARTGKSTSDIRAGAGIGEAGDSMFTLQSGKQHAVASTGEISHCLNAGGMGRQDYETETPVVEDEPKAYNCQGSNVGESGTLRAGNGSHTGGVPFVVSPIHADADRASSLAITPSPDAEGRVRLRDPGLGIGAADDPMFALTATKPHAIAFSCKDGGGDAAEEISPTLRAMSEGEGGHANAGGQVAVAGFYHTNRQPEHGIEQDLSPPIKVGSGGQSGNPPAVMIPDGSSGFSGLRRSAGGAGDTPTLTGDIAPAVTGQQAEGVLAADPIAFVQNGRSEVREMGGDGQIVGALAAEPGAQQQTYVAETRPEALAFQTRIARNGRGQPKDIVDALNGSDAGATSDMRPVVAIAPTLRAGGNQTGGDRPPGTDVDTVGSLLVSDLTTSRFECKACGRRFGVNDYPDDPECPDCGETGELFDHLQDEGGEFLDGVAFKPSHFTRGNDGAPSDAVPPLSADADKGDQDPVLFQGAAVRRLTPRECERLQGFPDDFTMVSYRGKPASDGPRYKALGNSMAVPVLSWILRRVLEVDRAV